MKNKCQSYKLSVKKKDSMGKWARGRPCFNKAKHVFIFYVCTEIFLKDEFKDGDFNMGV